jgi:hypothetical protein
VKIFKESDIAERGIPPLLVKWSKSSLWIYKLLNDEMLSKHIPQEMRDEGWEMIQDYYNSTWGY